MNEYQITPMKRSRSWSSDEQSDKAKSQLHHLCQRCEKAPWSWLVQKSRNNQPVDDFKVLIPESHEQLQSSLCQVCQLLAFLKPSSLDNSKCHLEAFNLTELFTPERKVKYPGQSDTALLSIFSESNRQGPGVRKQLGHVIAVEPSLQGLSVPEHENINFGLISDWMKYCVHEHSSICRPGVRSSTEPLEVIDCRNPEDINLDEPPVVSLRDDSPYAALSYVWGNGNDKFPQVVKDSMKVARLLDCNYIWVDRRCIPQDVKEPKEREKKQRLIETMDEIYSQACFTIVDAAGEDSNYGLAGVSGPRMPRRCAQVHGAKLTYLGTPPAEKVRSSRWASRGWTYQEGILSHRRIFFTDEQVMFQCNTMTCIESFEIPMGVLHRLQSLRERNKPNERMKPFLNDTEPLILAGNDIVEHMKEFSKRNLTKDSDTLKAFLGVLNDFRKKGECFHLYGSPIPLDKKKGHLINAWYHTKPGARNVNFPSWSWMGWKGEIKTTSRYHPDYEVRLFKSRTTSPENIDHDLRLFKPEQSISLDDPISLDGYKEECGTNPSLRMEPVIELEGMITQLSFELIRWNSEAGIPRETAKKDGAWAVLPLTENVTCYSFLYLDNEALTGICQFKLPVMLIESGLRSRDQNVVILVLREKGGRFERAGMVILWGKEDKAKSKLPMYRDERENWIEPVSIPKLQNCIWYRGLKHDSILLQ